MATTQICPTTCGAELSQPPPSYQDLCAGKPELTLYGGSFLGFLKCDAVPGDPTSKASWQALIDSGDFVISPCGSVDAAKPDQETAKLSKCGGVEVLKTTHNWNFETHETDPNRKDYEYFENLACSKQYKVVRFDCEGWMYVTDEYYQFANGNTTEAPTGSPGFPYTITDIPHPEEGEADFKKWTMGISIELGGCTLIKPIYVEGLYECLQGVN